MVKKNLAMILAQSLISPMQEFRKAEERKHNNQLYGGAVRVDNALLKEHEQTIIKRSQKFHAYELEMFADDYWGDIIVAKIEIIGRIGELELMQEIHDLLEEWHENDKFRYSSLFDRKANGMFGWMS